MACTYVDDPLEATVSEVALLKNAYRMKCNSKSLTKWKSVNKRTLTPKRIFLLFTELVGGINLLIKIFDGDSSKRDMREISKTDFKNIL